MRGYRNESKHLNERHEFKLGERKEIDENVINSVLVSKNENPSLFEKKDWKEMDRN